MKNFIVFVIANLGAPAVQAAVTHGRGVVQTGPHMGPAAEVLSDSTGLFGFEKIQLTDRVLANLGASLSSDVSPFLFAKQPFGRAGAGKQGVERAKCKTYPGDTQWPSPVLWKLFDVLLGAALIKTIPEAAPCYSDWEVYSPSRCQNLGDTWNNSTLRIEDPTSIRAILFQGMTCMPSAYTAVFLGNNGTCTVGGFPEYSVNVSNVAQMQLAVNIARELNLRLVIKNTGHDFAAKSTGHGGLSLWMHHLKDAEFYRNYRTDSYSGPAFKLGAGIQVYDINRLAKEYGVTVVGGEGRTVGFAGGYIQGGGHSPLTSIWGMAADHVLSIQLVTADGRFVTADADTNADLFWAVRGGGGSAFGVLTSVIVKAFPKIKVTTLMYNMTTGGNFTRDAFWAAQKAYVDRFEQYADLGYYAYYRILHQGTGISHTMASMVAPNVSVAEFRATMAPLWTEWNAIGVPFEPTVREYDNYSDAWAEGFPQEVWTWGMRQASRLIPRETIADEQQRAAIFDSIRGVFEAGANLIMFNIRNPPGAENIDNAVNPAWRKVLMFALMFVTWDVKAPTDYVTALSRNLTFEWNPRWRALTPGSGTYQSESDYIEPEWQQSFHGSKYSRLYEIKQAWDPEGVFYAQKAVGSEDWELGDLILGHLPSQNSKLCRK